MAIKLGGHDILGPTSLTWGYTSGADPQTANVVVTPGVAEELWEATKDNNPTTLAIGAREFYGIFIVGERPSTHPQQVVLEITDIRWFFKFVSITARYNIKRKSGDKRWLSTNDSLEEFDVADDIDFVVWSLNPIGRRWRAAEVIEDVVERLRLATRSVRHWTYSITTGRKREEEIEDFRLEGDKGNAALDRAMALIGETSCYVDEDGDLILYDRLSGGEEPSLVGGPLVFGSQLPRIYNRSRFRPSKIRVLFTREMEVRFDYTEDADTSAGSTNSSGRGDNPVGLFDSPRTLSNVVMNPYPRLTNTRTGNTVERGEWMDMSDYFDSVSTGVTKLPTATKEPFSHATMRQLWVMGLMNRAFAAPPSIAPDPLWSRIVQAAYNHFRQTFQFQGYWQHRWLSWTPHRLAVIDAETGTRGTGNVFADYSMRFNVNMVGKMDGAEDGKLVVNVEGYHANIKDATPSQARATIEDHDQGIVRVNYLAYPWQDVKIYPGFMTNILDVGFVPKFGLANETGQVLTEDHNVAVIVTMVPAAPNNNRQYHPIEVSLEDAQNKLGITLGPAEGPVMEVVVDAAITTARFGWKDDESYIAELEKAFGQSDGNPNVEKLEVQLLDRNHLRDVAESVAASIYAESLDRVEGTIEYAGLLKMSPDGFLSNVQYTVDPSGKVTTRAELPAAAAKISMKSLLGQGTRARLFRQIRG